MSCVVFHHIVRYRGLHVSRASAAPHRVPDASILAAMLLGGQLCCGAPGLRELVSIDAMTKGKRNGPRMAKPTHGWGRSRRGRRGSRWAGSSARGRRGEGAWGARQGARAPRSARHDVPLRAPGHTFAPLNSCPQAPRLARRASPYPTRASAQIPGKLSSGFPEFRLCPVAGAKSIPGVIGTTDGRRYTWIGDHRWPKYASICARDCIDDDQRLAVS